MLTWAASVVGMSAFTRLSRHADSGHSRTGLLKALGEVRGALLSLVGERFEPCANCSASYCCSPLGFQNCTKTAKYEALEKNVVSNRKLPSLRQTPVRSFTWKVPVCWRFWGWSTALDSRPPWSMAEGEELGSNLLHVGKSTPASSCVRSSWQRRGQGHHEPEAPPPPGGQPATSILGKKSVA
jgi:hypothetical protein